MSTAQDISENAVDSWYEYANEVFGTLTLTAAISALQFKDVSAEIATILLLYIFTLYVVMAYKRKIRFHQDRLSRFNGKVKVTFEALAGTLFFLFGFISLVTVALGVDVSFVKGFSLKSVVM